MLYIDIALCDFMSYTRVMTNAELKEIRKKMLKLSQAELAKEMDICRRQYIRIENGKAKLKRCYAAVVLLLLEDAQH